MSLPDDKIKQLKLQANTIRQDLITMLLEAGSGHSAGPLDMTDVFTAVYFAHINHDPQNPTKPDRDRVVLSNGHICPVLYATLANVGYFPREELKTLRKYGSRLQGHPHRTSLPGLETTSGPLGSGLSQGSGMALAAKMDGASWRVIVLMSDGEHDEGNVWEAVLFAAKNKLDNLVVVIDRNNIQIDGNTEDIMPLDPFGDKYRAFNWNVIEVDGHDFNQIIDALEQAKQTKGKPTIVVANTIPGKGVDFMEGKYEWHGKPPNKEEAEKALEQLKAEEERIKSS
jgi:transketolase